ncbi:hypothetical protein OIU78_023973 [Salix suchowensis]|nr:hypothetical protein OIU78_023973 [Salix suchowensis]
MSIAIIACILIGICEPLLITGCSVLEKFEVLLYFKLFAHTMFVYTLDTLTPSELKKKKN